MNQNLIFGILFWKILFRFRAYNFLHSSTRFSGHHQSFFKFFNFLPKSLKANKNQRRRSLMLQHNFAQKTSLILRSSTHLTLKTICFRNTDKNFLTLQISQQTNFTILCSRDVIRFYLVGVNNFLKAARCLSLVKCFTIFHFN